MMYSYPGSQYIILLVSLLATAHASIMVKLVDGSFAPLSFERRAPGDGLPLHLTNHDDMSYLVSSNLTSLCGPC
jgi:hypothetical protein